jgi:cytochrome c
MHDQPRIEAFEENAFFADGVGSRPIPAGTVARGHLREDTHLYEGIDAEGNVVDALPTSLAMTPEFLWRGKERFEIYCSVCHGSTGAGDGMIVRRGFKQPPPLWEDRLVALPLGYFYDVMTNGFGVMSSYASQVPVVDRWAIAAYIRALQFSQGSDLAALPTGVQDDFQQALLAQQSARQGEDDHQDGQKDDGDGEHH